MNNTKIRILFFKVANSTFVLNDERFLKEHYHTKSFLFKQKRPITLLLSFLRQLFFLIWNIWKSDVVFCWFADYHSFLPTLFSKLFQKKSIIVLGGSDTTYIKEYKYGVFSNVIRSNCASFAIANSNYLLPVHISLTNRVTKHVKKIKGIIIELPTGWSSEKFRCFTPKLDQVLYVATASDYQRIMIKGVDRFAEIARKTPEINFVLVGVKESAFKYISPIPSNLKVLPFVEDLSQVYSESKVFFQPSRTEGFPSVLCEAMLSECLPLATDVGGARTIIGENIQELVLDGFDQKIISPKISDLIQTYSSKEGASFRQYIIDNFPPNKRMKKLMEIIG